MALTADRETAHKDTELLRVKLAAAIKLFVGALVATNAAGYGQPAADAAGLKVAGVSGAQVDNSLGADGDLSTNVRRNKAFLFKNSTTNPVSQAHFNSDIYVEDDETVSSDGGVNNIVAGKCLGIEPGGVLVYIGN